MITALAALMATGAMASSFRAADTVYLPVAGKTPGAASSFFRTDVWLANVSPTPATVWVAYARRGQDNASAPANALRLTPDLAAGERRQIVDIMGAVFGFDDDDIEVGHLIFFAYRQGLESADCDDSPADCRLITVQGRIYTTAADGSTFGQDIPGIPWYNSVGPESASLDLHRVFITGIRQFGTAGVDGYRTNIGLVNASMYETATLRARLFSATGVQFGATYETTLPPLGFIQPNITAMFSGFTGDGYWLEIEQVDTAAQDLAFLAFASLLDNKSNDPTTLEAQYFPEMDWSCVYSSKPPSRAVRRGGS